MLKFSLTANDMQREGFKVTVQADTQAESAIAQELMDKLIAKISIIEIKQSVNSEY